MASSIVSNHPLIILNPAANRGKMGYFRAVVRSRVEREQADYVETTKQREAKELGADAAREGRPIIIVGGDGTVHEGVNGILSTGRRVPVGIVVARLRHDFAWDTLGLPRD